MSERGLVDGKWTHPREIDDVTLAFPANALELMPSRDECEVGLRALPPEQRKKWMDFQKRWFFRGLPSTAQFALSTNGGKTIDGDAALRHLGAIQGSFAPAHQHKEAAVAYLASLWFEDVAYDGFDTEPEDPTP